jgi:imidazolonepropionase-like amidohydrolase
MTRSGSTRAFAAFALAALFATDLDAQRPRRGRRDGPPSGETPAEAPKPETKPVERKTAVKHWLAITGGDVYLGTGQMLRRATVLVGDRTIEAVGHDLQLPEGTEVLDATGRVVGPGYVAVKATGFGSPSSLPEGDVRDGLNPYDPSVKMALAAGITSFVAIYDPGSAKPGGRTAVVKLAYGDLPGMVLAENSVQVMRVPLHPAQWKDLRDLVQKAKDHLGKQGEAGGKEGAGQTGARPEGEKDGSGSDRSSDRGSEKGPDQELEPILRLLRGEARLWVGCSQLYDTTMIRQALEIARLLGHGVVLENPVTAWTVADEIAATGSMVITNPRLRVQPDSRRPHETGTNFAMASILSRAGVPVAVRCPDGIFGGEPTLDTNGILGQDLHTLPMDAAFAVRGGMDDQKALRTITLDAAKIAGVESRIGSIEAGKDADLLILDGDPLHYTTFVTTAVVNGKVVYQKDKEPFYSHLGH